MTNAYKSLFIFVIFAGLLAVAGDIKAAWSGPCGASPSNCNVSAPLNLSSTGQAKVGGLELNTGGATNGLIVHGGLCLGGVYPAAGTCITSWAGAGGGQWATSGNDIYNTNTGKVGIGNSTPAAPLHITGGTGWTENGWSRSLIVERSIQFGYGSGVRWGFANDNNFNIFKAAGDGGIGSGVTSDYILSINGVNRRVGIGVYSGSVGSGLTVYGNASIGTGYFTTSAPADGMIVQGNVGIGTASPGYKLDVAGVSSAWAAHIANSGATSYGLYIQAGNSSSDYPLYINNAPANNTLFYITGAGNVVVSGSVTAGSFLYSSDERLKKNIEPILGASALKDVLALEPVTYDWKDPARGTGTQLGFIAQQVEKVVPQLVSTNASTTLKAVDYARAVPLLVGAIQEQQKQIDELKAEIKELKAGK